jgi:hypothetical protein
MRVLVACEFSGIVRDAFAAAGHDAWSCDLLPCEAGGQHITGDVLQVLADGWDLMIAHPPCTYLCVSGMHWTRRGKRRQSLTDDALEFVRQLMAAPIARIAIENPVSIISTEIRPPDQVIQPWQFGHDASKKTCLWLQGLPKLKPTMLIKPRLINGKPRWQNQTDSGQNKLPPTKDRWKLRAKTYQGIAEAMATQWGNQSSLARQLNLPLC